MCVQIQKSQNLGYYKMNFTYFIYPPWLLRHFQKLPGCLSPHFLFFNQPRDPGLPQILDRLCSELQFSSVLFSPVTQSCMTLCNPMNRSTPGLPVHHQLPEFTQTHVHWVGDAIQPSHPLSSPSLPALNPSQYQTLFQWVSSSHEVAKVLEFQL